RNYTKSQSGICKREQAVQDLRMTSRLLRELAKIMRTKCDSYCRCRIIEKNSLSFSKWKRWQALNRLRAQWSVWASRIFKLRRRKLRASVILGEEVAWQAMA